MVCCCPELLLIFTSNASLDNYDLTYYNDGSVRYYLANYYRVSFECSLHARVEGVTRAYRMRFDDVRHSISSSFIDAPLPADYLDNLGGYTETLKFSEDGTVIKVIHGHLEKYLSLSQKYYYNYQNSGSWRVDDNFHLSAGYVPLLAKESYVDIILDFLKQNYEDYHFYSKQIERLVYA